MSKDIHAHSLYTVITGVGSATKHRSNRLPGVHLLFTTCPSLKIVLKRITHVLKSLRARTAKAPPDSALFPLNVTPFRNLPRRSNTTDRQSNHRPRETLSRYLRKPAKRGRRLIARARCVYPRRKLRMPNKGANNTLQVYSRIQRLMPLIVCSAETSSVLLEQSDDGGRVNLISGYPPSDVKYTGPRDVHHPLSCNETTCRATMKM